LSAICSSELIAACLRESLCISRAFALLLDQAIYPVSGHKLLATLPVSSQSLDKSYALNFLLVTLSGSVTATFY
jgi:hypothetical protein